MSGHRCVNNSWPRRSVTFIPSELCILWLLWVAGLCSHSEHKNDDEYLKLQMSKVWKCRCSNYPASADKGIIIHSTQLQVTKLVIHEGLVQRTLRELEGLLHAAAFGPITVFRTLNPVTLASPCGAKKWSLEENSRRTFEKWPRAASPGLRHMSHERQCLFLDSSVFSQRRSAATTKTLPPNCLREPQQHQICNLLWRFTHWQIVLPGITGMLKTVGLVKAPSISLPGGRAGSPGGICAPPWDQFLCLSEKEFIQ